MSALAKLCGEGWTFVTMPETTDEASVIARYGGEPIRAGVRTETVTDTQSEMHLRYRTGQYDLDIKIDFDIRRGMIRVTEAIRQIERASGYESK